MILALCRKVGRRFGVLWKAYKRFTGMLPLRKEYLSFPLQSRLALGHPRRSEILERHQCSVEEGKPTYADPSSGLSVMTARFLAERGYCCTSGCRHCPFEQAQ